MAKSAYESPLLVRSTERGTRGQIEENMKAKDLVIKVLEATKLYRPAVNVRRKLRLGLAQLTGSLEVFDTKQGKSCTIHPTATVMSCELADHVNVSPSAYLNSSTIGLGSSIGRGTVVFHSDIGKYCAISWYCIIGAYSPPYNSFANCEYVSEWADVNLWKTIDRQVSVGSDVKIGAHAIILSGVTIGHGAIVAAGAVVTKDVPPFAIVRGTPASIIKYRFSPDIIGQLLELAWWDWGIDRVEANAKILNQEVNLETIRMLKHLRST